MFKSRNDDRAQGGVIATRTLATVNNRRESIILQQPLDVIDLDLRAQRMAEPPPQLLENAARALHIDLTRYLDAAVAIQAAVAIGIAVAPERVGVVGARPAVAAGRPIAQHHALLLQRLRQGLGAAPHRL